MWAAAATNVGCCWPASEAHVGSSKEEDKGLHLKVLSHLNKDVPGDVKGLGVLDACDEKATCNWQVEGIKGCLVGHNAHVVV